MKFRILSLSVISIDTTKYKTNIIHSDNNYWIVPNWGCKAKTCHGVQLRPLLQRRAATDCNIIETYEQTRSAAADYQPQADAKAGYDSVWENMCNNSKKRKKWCFWILKKT